LLAKNVNDNACLLNKRGAYGFFASKLAPTVSRACTLPHVGVGSDAEGLYGSIELPTQHQQVFALATPLADTQQVVLT